jgi:large subunit ribosomal protein L21
MYAIVESGSKQYKVSKDTVIDVELLDAKPEKEIKLEHVLFFSDGKHVEFGAPHIKGAHVTARVIGNVKDDKVTTFKYKNKTNYHRTIGHRQNYTRIQITAIAAK